MGMDAINSVNYTSPKPVSEPISTGNSVDVSVVAASMNANSSAMQNKVAEKQPTEDEIKHAISSANKRAMFGHTNAQFSYHDETHSISVKIIDKDTNEVIKEIPSEQTLEMISKMWEMAGLMVDEKR